LELPSFYNKDKEKDIRLIDYGRILKEANRIKRKYRIKDCRYENDNDNALVLFDYQNRNISKTGSQISNTCEFIYNNISNIKDIFFFYKSKNIIDITSPVFWVNSSGSHPEEGTVITKEDYKSKKWKITDGVKANYTTLDIRYVTEHCNEVFAFLSQIIISHIDSTANDVNSAVISSIQESLCYFSSIRKSQVYFVPYDTNPLFESTSVFSNTLTNVSAFASNSEYISRLKSYSYLIFGGLEDKFLIENIKELHRGGKYKGFHLLKDCSVISDSLDLRTMRSKGLNIFNNSGKFRE
jgi:hypothetical protein